MKRQFMNRRNQMFVIGLIVWLLLACWTISAFWTHIDELGESYQFAARMGAMAVEVIGLGFLFWCCFDKSITVRRWALVFALLLSIILVFHAGALRGIRDAKMQQIETEHRLAQTLTQMSTAQAQAVADANKQYLAAPAWGTAPVSRRALINSTTASQTQIANSAQEKIAAEIGAGDRKIKESAIVPLWYLNGWMYAAMFIAGMLMLSILHWQMSTADDLDANYNGVPDRLEQETVRVTAPVEPALQPVQPRPTPALERERVTWQYGRRPPDEQPS